MAEELGDDDEVGAAAHERGREGVPQDVGGRVVVEAGGRGDRGDDVVGAPDAEALAALVEEQGGTVVGAGPVGALAEPAGERGVQLRVDRDLPDAFALAVDPQDAFAGGAGDVVDVEGDDLADPGTGVNGTSASAWSRGDGQAPTARRYRSWARLSSARGAAAGISTRAALAGPRPRRM